MTSHNNKCYFNLDNLSGFEFEDLVARVMRKIGYQNIKVTQKSGDYGKDILMTYKKEDIEYPIIVECKHQQFVGRPIIQKLQGAMLHEKKDKPFVKGIVVTSGIFSPTVTNYLKETNNLSMEIELIDGKQLKKLCERYNILILNGKIQIVTDNVMKYLNESEMIKKIKQDYQKIVGYNYDFLNIQTDKCFYPCYYINYNLNSETHTQAGCIYNVHLSNQQIFLYGDREGEIDESLKLHFFSIFPTLEKLAEKNVTKIIPFEYTENDIEKEAFNIIINRYTKNVKYTGKNNVKYLRICSPSPRDIDINEAIPLYLPKYLNKIKIKDYNYSQEIFVNEDALLYVKNQLERCVICSRTKFLWNNKKYLCQTCGKILCVLHKRLDRFDKTPICHKHCVEKRLFIQKVYFASKSNLDKFNDIWVKKSLLKKIKMDKILMSLIILTLYLLMMLIKVV